VAKWLTLPADKLFHQQVQQDFLTARRERQCLKCKKLFSCPPDTLCPSCGAAGVRRFDRLTIIAGRRFGKSRIGAIAAVEELCIPNSIVWACAPTNPKLNRYILPAFQQLIPEDWVRSYSTEFNDLRLKNGSLLHLQTLEDPDQGRGQGLDCLWIDEVCELSQAHWEVISPSLADKQGVAFFTTSPRSYDWVWENLYKPAEDNVPGFWAAHATTAMNPIISDEYLAREKQRLSDTMFRQEYMADFVIFTGAVYGGLLDPQILRTTEEIKQIIPEWPQIESWRQITVGIDTGADHPFGAVKLVSTERGLVVVGEYLERHKTFIQHTGMLKQLAGSSTTRWGINKNERQAMLELAQHGIYCQKAENDQVAGTERVKSWLHQRQLWFVESLCPQTIKQMKAYRWAEDKARDGQLRKEKVYKLNDELPDCIRYALMTWPTLPKSAPEIEVLARDLSKLPGEMRAIIERNRRIDPDPAKKEQEVVAGVGEFYA
jgi:hypothetical protein